jgi:hypothetical protein
MIGIGTDFRNAGVRSGAVENAMIVCSCDVIAKSSEVLHIKDYSSSDDGFNSCLIHRWQQKKIKAWSWKTTQPKPSSL